jgi:hypothetical protein
MGDLETARRHLQDAQRSPVPAHSTAWRAAVLEARAHLAAAEGDHSAPPRLLREAAECFEAAGQPLDAARCRAVPAEGSRSGDGPPAHDLPGPPLQRGRPGRSRQDPALLPAAPRRR